MKNIVITGVSTGIGYGCSKEFIKRGYRVFGSVRKDRDAKRLKAELGHQFIPLVFDVTDHTAVHLAAKQVKEQIEGGIVDGLFNNAGISVFGPIDAY